MPQLIGLVVVGAGLWAGLKALQRIAEQMTAGKSEPPPQSQAGVAEKDLGRLELDPATGVYRPVERRQP